MNIQKIIKEKLNIKKIIKEKVNIEKIIKEKLNIEKIIKEKFNIQKIIKEKLNIEKIIKEKLNIEKNIKIDKCHRAGKKQNNRSRTQIKIQGQAIDFKKLKQVKKYFYLLIYCVERVLFSRMLDSLIGGPSI